MTQTQHKPQRHRLSTCHRHPTTKPITGFCASCLCERLAGIENQSPSSSSSSAAPAAATANSHLRLRLRLRRTKSCSGGNPEEVGVFSALSEQPRRRSCDVRAHSTLHDLFSVDDERPRNPIRKPRVTDLGLVLPVSVEDEEREKEEIRSVDKSKQRLVVEEFEDGAEFKTMKEFIDLEWGNRSKKSTGRDFKEIASFLGKKVRKWTQRQKYKKNDEMPDGGYIDRRLVGRRVRETESEVGEYGLGRRSCDTDPRLSIDAGRISVDDSRFSLDEPRASWDGCLSGKNYPRLTPLDSVVEDVKATPVSVDAGKEEEGDENDKSPGGSAQTRDYYADPLSLQRRRKSFDRSNSLKRGGLLEVNDVKAISNTKVSPETVGLFHGAKLLVTEKELRDSNWYSLKDYGSESINSATKAVGYAGGEVSGKGLFSFKNSKMSRSVWKIWGLMQKRSEGKSRDDEEKHVAGNVVEGSLAESLQKLRKVANGEPNGSVSQKLIRSYSVSTRNSCDGLFNTINGGIEGGRSSCDALYHGMIGVEVRGDSFKRKDNLFLQRNRSSRYSPNNLDNNGLLRFYLTPLRSYRRSQSGKSRLKNSYSIGGSVM